MKSLMVPALALGLAMALATPASAGLFHRDNCCDPCKPACPKPACKPACPKPACDPCDPCQRGCLSRLGSKVKGWVKNLCHRDRCCDPCGGTITPVHEHVEGHAIYSPTTGPRLAPIPATVRTTRRTFGN